MFQGAYIYAEAKRGEIPDIYVQDYTYFDEYRDDIKKLYGEGIGQVDMVAVHVRRASNPINPDEPKYAENSFYVNLMDSNYYEEAMLQFTEVDYLIFSDDIEWCKTQPLFSGCEFSEGRTEVEDLNLMASCKGIITANSSFSWWAAYLSNAKVVAPLAWYRDGIERTTCPPEWLRL